MKYLFILGRNPELSIAEIFSYFKKSDLKILEQERIENGLLLDFEDTIDSGIVENLGGTIAVGKVLAEGHISTITKLLDSQDIYYGTENKLNYCVWKFCKEDFYDFILDYLKQRFKREKLKTTFKPLMGILELQGKEKTRIASGLLDEEYFVFNNCFGKIIEKTDYKKLEERDMNKPERREALSISPRLAKIMINLSEAKEGEKIVDSFCGVGVILSEALIQQIKVIGIDKNEEAIAGAKKNLEWMKFEKANYKLINEDSRRVKIEKVDAMVSEPDLGKTLKKVLGEKQAKETLYKFEDLIIKVINNLKKSVSKRFVFTAPYIKLNNNKRIGCNINFIIERTELRLVNQFKEYRDNQIVGREIFVLQK